MSAAHTQAASQYLVFQLANQSFAAALPDIAEIVLVAELSPPFAPSEVLAGFLNVGGQALPVFKLNRILNLKDSAATLYSHIVFIKTSGTQIGFLIQAAQKILSIEPGDLRESRIEGQKAYSHTMLSDKNTFIGIVELRRIAEHYLSALAHHDQEELPPLVKAAS